MNSAKNSIKYLSNEMIEQQAWQDLLNFNKKTKKGLSFPVYPEEIIKALWDIEVEYQDSFCELGEDILACFIPSKKLVRVYTKNNSVEGRVSFSLAHEAGHISLHNFLEDKDYPIKDLGIERQADRYASAILMPKELFTNKLNSLGYSSGEKLDLNKHGKILTDYFGVSFYALEIRLSNLGINYTSGLYEIKPKKEPDKLFDELDIERQNWSFEDTGRT